MKIQSIKVQHLQIPMRLKFAQANNATQKSNAVILTLTTTQGVTGYGESCPRPYVTGETIDSIAQDIRSFSNVMMDKNFIDVEGIQDFVVQELPGKMGLAAICALELALLDAWGKENEISLLNTFKNQTILPIRYSGVVPFGNLARMEPLLQQFDFRDIKIKVGQDLIENLRRVERLKAIFHEPVTLRVDANCGWSFAGALAQIPALMEAGVTVFEQCFPKDRDQDMAKITALYGKDVVIMADESLCSYENARFLAENGICNGFNLKISKNGGIFNTLRILKLAKQYSIHCQLGAHFGETSILTMAGLLVTVASPTILHRHEGALGTILLKKDLCEQPLQINQHAIVNSKQYPFGNGLGINISSRNLKNHGSNSHSHQVELAYYNTRAGESAACTYWV